MSQIGVFFLGRGSRSQNWLIFKVKTFGVSVKYLFPEIFTISSFVLKTRPEGPHAQYILIDLKYFNQAEAVNSDYDTILVIKSSAT